jgi:hypothetical protein
MTNPEETGVNPGVLNAILKSGSLLFIDIPCMGAGSGIYFLNELYIIP